MRIDILSLFPEFIESFSNWSMINKAIENTSFSLGNINIRDFSENKHKKVDDYPFGGGPGMVMTPQPIYDAIESVRNVNSRVIYLSPQGKSYDQEKAKELSKEEHLILLCGHYEGIDNRIVENYIDEEISIGDFVLTGGELAAMMLVDSVVRLLPGVLASQEAIEDESHYNGLLEHPQYTRPRVFRDKEVPEILLSGNHRKIEEWKIEKSLETTYLKRPDLLEGLSLDRSSLKILEKIKLEKDNK